MGRWGEGQGQMRDGSRFPRATHALPVCQSRWGADHMLSPHRPADNTVRALRPGIREDESVQRQVWLCPDADLLRQPISNGPRQGGWIGIPGTHHSHFLEVPVDGEPQPQASPLGLTQDPSLETSEPPGPARSRVSRAFRDGLRVPPLSVTTWEEPGLLSGRGIQSSLQFSHQPPPGDSPTRKVTPAHPLLEFTALRAPF